jgi:V8-like Glu-specific endopeptidase
MPQLTEFIDRLRQLLGEGEVAATLEQLEAHLRGGNRELHNESILLNARYVSVQSRRRRGLLTEDSLAAEMNRLVLSALEFLDFVQRKQTRADLPFATSPIPIEAPGDSRLEKIFGTSHLRSISWLLRGLNAARSVCRVLTPEGLGTGFLICGNRILTNHHVLPDARIASSSEVEFNYQEDSDNRVGPVSRYHLNPQSLVADEVLDYAIVEVHDQAPVPIERWGPLPLAPQAAVRVGDHVTIIQHPSGGLKQIAITANQVVNIFEHRLQYTTDTLPGSSGSPVFNDDWKVIAIHHAGGNLVANARGDRMFANEGILLSAIPGLA